MTDGWQIAVLGATGAVGEALLELLAEREFPVGELHLLASVRSAGESIRFNGKSHVVQDAAEFDWSQAQMAFFVAGAEASLRYAQAAADAGCLVIDSSGVFSLEPDVPLIVPGVNNHALSEYRNRNIIAVASSLTGQLLTAVKPLSESAGIARLQATVMLAASAHGKAAVEELAGQSARLLNGLPIEEGIFNRQLAFNLLPLLPDAEGSVLEERRLVDETRKVLQDDTLPVSASCIQSPVFYGSAQIVHFEGMREMSPEEAVQALENADDVQVSEEGDYPTQVGDATGNPHLSIGCLRSDYGQPERLQFWSVADNVRFGGALMAVKTAESLIQEYLY
ncbi:aspartate-semialdehyde dehydrogenase [Leminorella grimontii]|uniref:Aspartate-semialdehyde dehydrogenase n=1 Tax=Leminorella grimontii TaxID=82981 RepID=A0AAV5MZ30_9GAMM|nr:aspartate-semialdehyde dehydrogenase [Leminorella grimontii]KFC95388.1 aspartate-semialdehyde dehydrogenase [Leminorella grimontii ATCC 33999 = DSM 5078]GKX54044.1 aspartate-semialdehyde dehydrogenase [Leminorella grimontii]VFS60204.1 USG-1 protein [Leminorella grimontii]